MSGRSENLDPIALPAPRRTGEMSLEETIALRRSVREYASSALTLAELSQLLWAGQGITEPRERLRAAPSAGALYPLELYAVAGDVGDLAPGVYGYAPREHALVPIWDGDRRRDFSRLAAGQTWIARAPAIVVIAAVYARTTNKYGERGRKYVHMDVGHAAENMCLQAVALGLGSTVVGAFEDTELKALLSLPGAAHPLCAIVVGRDRKRRSRKDGS